MRSSRLRMSGLTYVRVRAYQPQSAIRCVRITHARPAQMSACAHWSQAVDAGGARRVRGRLTICSKLMRWIGSRQRNEGARGYTDQHHPASEESGYVCCGQSGWEGEGRGPGKNSAFRRLRGLAGYCGTSAKTGQQKLMDATPALEWNERSIARQSRAPHDCHQGLRWRNACCGAISRSHGLL